jgi:hypothetical protein
MCQHPQRHLLSCRQSRKDVSRSRKIMPLARRKISKTAQRAFENAVNEARASAERHANLGLLYAFMGRKDDAIHEGRRAVKLKSESKDAFDGAIMNCCLALI